MGERVAFRIEKEGGAPLAVFPDLKADQKGNMTCYAHIGQHSACTKEYVRDDTTPAEYSEYAPLLRELTEQVGYEDLEVIKEMVF